MALLIFALEFMVNDHEFMISFQLIGAGFY